MRDTPTKALRLEYTKLVELGLVISLMLTIVLMQFSKKLEQKSTLQTVKLEVIKVEEMPQTQQQKQEQAPSRPTVPIASEDEDLPEDETIDFTEFDISDDAAPPPPPPDETDEEAIVFVPYDEPPTPIGGFAAIQKGLEYPEIARKAGVEGRVLVYAQVDEEGIVQRTRVIQSLGPNGCDEAAIEAIKAVKWKPAKQRDRAVKVWIAVPVDFKLR